MRRYHLHQAVRAAKLSALEEGALLAGIGLLLAGLAVALVDEDPAGLARVLGSAGLAALMTYAASRGVRRYGTGVTASLPTSVARVPVRARPLRVFSATTVALALGLPLAAAAAVVGGLGWGWLVVAGVLALGCIGMFVTWVGRAGEDEEWSPRSAAAASELLRRLCMRADMPVPGLVVAPGPLATAWTARGRIHVTRPLLALLDEAELEAVLAHELAHLAHRDAAVVEICSAPSRVLLAFAGSVVRWFARWVRSDGMLNIVGGGSIALALAALSTFCAPPAFVLGWISRLSVLGISRAREFSADAAAATLTGRPSALASALLKLEDQCEWAPRSDLRQVEPYAVLCIVGTTRSRLGRLLSTHPPTEARVKRLEELETRIQARPGAGGRR